MGGPDRLGRGLWSLVQRGRSSGRRETMSPVTEEHLEDIGALFVQTAGTMSTEEGKTITRRGLSPSRNAS
jgi:hypothetical protein